MSGAEPHGTGFPSKSVHSCHRSEAPLSIAGLPGATGLAGDSRGQASTIKANYLFLNKNILRVDNYCSLIV